MFKVGLTNLVVAAILNMLAPLALAQSADLSCVRVRIALDVGSSSTKMRSALVDVCNHKILAQLKTDKAKVSWKDNVDANKKIAFSYIKSGLAEIASTLQKLTEATRAELRSEPYNAYRTLADMEIEHAGGATATIRDSSNRAEFLTQAKAHGLRIRILTQAEEGHLGYLGIFAFLANDPNFFADPTKFLSWDIGSVSMQLVGHFGDERTPRQWYDFGTLLSGDSIKEMILKDFLKKPLSESPNPIITSPDQEERVYALAEQTIRNNKDVAAILKSQSSNWMATRSKTPGVSVYGVGGLHGGVLSVVKKFPGFEKAKGYTQAELRSFLSKLLYASNEELGKIYGVKGEFQAGTVTNVLLVYTAMRVLEIGRVEVADVDNTAGLLLTPGYWKKIDSPVSPQGRPPTP